MPSIEPDCNKHSLGKLSYDVYLSVEYQGRMFVDKLLEAANKGAQERLKRKTRKHGDCINVPNMCFCQYFTKHFCCNDNEVHLGNICEVDRSPSLCICSDCAKLEEITCYSKTCVCEECPEGAYSRCAFEECICYICPSDLEMPCASETCVCRTCPEAESFVYLDDLCDGDVCPGCKPEQCQYSHFYDDMRIVYSKESNTEQINCSCDYCQCYNSFCGSDLSSYDECCCNECLHDFKKVVHSTCGVENIPQEVFNWPVIEDFTIEYMEKQLKALCNLWGLPSPWAFSVAYLKQQDTDARTVHVFEAGFFLHTLEYPVPQATASVYFYVEFDNIVPPWIPVGISYHFEGTRYTYKPFDKISHEVCLTRIINTKISFFSSLYM